MGTRREERARQPGPDGAGLIITAMVAVSFGSYGASLLFGDDAAGGWINVLASAVVLAMVALNFGGVSAAAKGQSLIVIVLLGVFAVFIAVTLANADWSLLAPSTYPPARDIVASVALTFFAYLGFAVISFTAGSLRDPQRTLPRAMYLGIAMAASIYVLVSLGTFGSLTPAEVSRYGDTALAHAAETALGQAGFTTMALAALLATASSVNANVFAAGNVTSMLAVEHQFPPVFGRRSRLGAPAGLIISAAVVLVLANAFDLTAIAHIGSAVAMVIFLLLGVAALRLRHETGSCAAIVLLAMVLNEHRPDPLLDRHAPKRPRDLRRGNLASSTGRFGSSRSPKSPGNFEPQIVALHRRRLDGVNEQDMFGCAARVREIQAHPA